MIVKPYQQTTPPMPNIRRFCLLSLGLFTALLSACSVVQGPSIVTYDLGSLPAASHSGPSAIVVDETQAPAWLDTGEILYRLDYSDPQQLRAYATARWTTPPSRLIEHRLKLRLAQQKTLIMNETDDENRATPRLRLELVDFSQTFANANQSEVRVMIRASIFAHRALIAQRQFESTVVCPQANAQGGVKALSQATDQVLDEIFPWLTTTVSKT